MPDESRRKQRVFVATGLTMQQSQTEFAELLQKFQRVGSEAEAEFVVMDLTSPPRDFSRYLGNRTSLRLPEGATAPLFFVNRGPDSAPHSLAYQVVVGRFSEPLRLCPDVSGLVRDMLWFQCLVPFVRDTPEDIKQMLAIVVQEQKHLDVVDLTRGGS